MVATSGSSLFANKKLLKYVVVTVDYSFVLRFRLLALKYGADLCYTEEIIDQKLLSSTRVVNNILNTVDYALVDDIVLRIAPDEIGRCVLQIGTNSGTKAAQVARMVGADVAAIDVNMGCPKQFSIHCGMGAALLLQVDKVKEILNSLVGVSQVPVSCKIRVLDDVGHIDPINFELSATLNLVRVIENCGVAAIAVHGRRRDERDPHPCRIDEIREIARIVGIPVIANGGSGDISCYDDILKFRSDTGTSSVMIARKALSCPSVFRREGVLQFDEDVRNFLELACECDENYTAIKYVVQRMLGSNQDRDPRGRETVLAGSVQEICRAWGCEEKYEKCRRDRFRKQNKRVFSNEISDYEYYDVTFPQKRLKDAKNASATPKCILFNYCKEVNAEKPVYSSHLRQQDKRFEGSVEVLGKKFRSRKGQPNTRMAEQVAALAALIGLNLRHLLKGDWEERQ
uniref:DRBM domain-containing protein n=1 Tax=Angiostrongylus cantonensis TaxID=6313 RepID=A0A0K0DHF3_ANGCA